MKTWTLALALVAAACTSTETSKSRAEPAQEQESEVRTAMEVVPLKYASSEQIASELRSALDGQKMQRSIRVVADPRTNSIIVTAPREDLARILELVAKLDVKAA